MKNKRALLTSLLLLLNIIVCIASVFAHSGRTDSNGGHWDRQSGTYHFHTGEYAGKSSGGSSGSEYVPFEPPYEPPKDNPYRKDSKHNTASKSNSFWNTIASMFVITFAFGFVVSIVATISSIIYDCCLEKHLLRYKTNLLNEKINKFQQNQVEIFEIGIKIFDLMMKYQIPDLYEIGKDNLPRDKNSGSNWGSSFTMYKTDKGKKLHKTYNCCFATEPVHIYWYRTRCNFSDSLCRKCALPYTLPDLSWYEEYLNCQRLKERQSRKERECQDLRKEIETLHKKCNSTINKILIVFSKRNRNALHEANALYNKMQIEFGNGQK